MPMQQRDSVNSSNAAVDDASDALGLMVVAGMSDPVRRAPPDNILCRRIIFYVAG